MLGWTPRETHEHEYDDDGRLVRTTVTREPEWDDAEREKMLGLALYEAKICACGLHESIADEDPDLEITERICPVCAGIAQQLRVLHAADEKRAGKNATPETPRPADGRHLGIGPPSVPK